MAGYLAAAPLSLQTGIENRSIPSVQAGNQAFEEIPGCRLFRGIRIPLLKQLLRIRQSLFRSCFHEGGLPDLRNDVVTRGDAQVPDHIFMGLEKEVRLSLPYLHHRFLNRVKGGMRAMVRIHGTLQVILQKKIEMRIPEQGFTQEIGIAGIKVELVENAVTHLVVKFLRRVGYAGTGEQTETGQHEDDSFEDISHDGYS